MEKEQIGGYDFNKIPVKKRNAFRLAYINKDWSSVKKTMQKYGVRPEGCSTCSLKKSDAEWLSYLFVMCDPSDWIKGGLLIESF